MYEVMVRMYGRLVIYKRKALKDVPEEYRKDVEKWVKAQK